MNIEKAVIDYIGEEKYNYQGCLMKIIEYNNANNLIVEFQDEHSLYSCACADR